MITLQQRGYVDRLDRKLIPTQIGLIVNDLLTEHFSNIVNVEFTAGMEDKLDAIAAGEQAWVPMLREFYAPFAVSVEEARDRMPQVEIKPEPTGEPCPECGRPLLFKHGRRASSSAAAAGRPAATAPQSRCRACVAPSAPRRSSKSGPARAPLLRLHQQPARR